MNTPPTQDELDQIKTIVGQITAAFFTAARPHVIEILTAAKTDPFADMGSGTITTLEPFEPIGLRDYRKQLWVETYSDWCTTSREDAVKHANAAVAAFDEAFPK